MSSSINVVSTVYLPLSPQVCTTAGISGVGMPPMAQPMQLRTSLGALAPPKYALPGNALIAQDLMFGSPFASFTPTAAPPEFQLASLIPPVVVFWSPDETPVASTLTMPCITGWLG